MQQCARLFVPYHSSSDRYIGYVCIGYIVYIVYIGYICYIGYIGYICGQARRSRWRSLRSSSRRRSPRGFAASWG